MRTPSFHAILAAIGVSVAGCGGSDSGGSSSGVGGASAGGTDNGTGGATASIGGSSQVAGSSSVGGTSAVGIGGNSTGGIAPTGGANNTGGGANTGGFRSTGGAPVATGGTKSAGGATNVTGGQVGTGGAPATGGKAATGGIASTGGKAATGGSPSAGGTLATGGSKAAGGAVATGGSKNTGGMMSTGGTSNGGAGSYKPCPTNGDPCKILPLGDSITWGVGYDGAYRVELFSKAVAGNKNITFTGSLSNGPNTVANTTFPKKNEGHSGWTISQDTGLIPSPALDTGSGGIPHIVLVHIGTNDIYASSGQSTMPDRLGTLIDKIISAAPNALVVVAKITPLLNNASWTTTVNTYNNAIPGLVQTRATAGKHVILADMNTGFTAPMLSSDGIHPTQAGYNFMGDQFYSVISSVLP